MFTSEILAGKQLNNLGGSKLWIYACFIGQVDSATSVKCETFICEPHNLQVN